MIKIRLRRNFVYLFIYYISSLFDNSFVGIFSSGFNINPALEFLYLKSFGNIFGGLLIYFYQYNSLKKKEKFKYFQINLIHNKKIISNGGKFKKALLIFFASFFDVFNLIIELFYKFSYNNIIIKLRASSIQAISSSLLYKYTFGFTFKKHHKISLIFIGIFLFFLIIH